MRVKNQFFVIVALGIFLFPGKLLAVTIPIDLNNFFTDPTVTVAGDGQSALMEEDPTFVSVLLSNDPFFGDPGIVPVSGAQAINFSLIFDEPAGNDDSFYAKVFEGISGDIIDDFYRDSSWSGPVSLSLLGMDPGVDLLGLEFQLNAGLGDGFLDSSASISNVHLETAAAPIPEPSSLLLFLAGAGGLLYFRKRKAVR